MNGVAAKVDRYRIPRSWCISMWGMNGAVVSVVYEAVRAVTMYKTVY
jgi:hypothetical protein